MRGLLLGESERRPLTLYVPKGAEGRGPLVGRCLVPGCAARFYVGEEAAWQRHVGDCARRNMDRINAMRPSVRHRGTPFDEDLWDPEVAKHLRTKVGPVMKREGRLEVKPHERAGFS